MKVLLIDGKFLRQKCYIEEFFDDKKFKGKLYEKECTKTKRKIKDFKNWLSLEVTCAGMPKKCYKHVSFNNFEIGFTCDDKLTFSHLPGRSKTS